MADAQTEKGGDKHAAAIPKDKLELLGRAALTADEEVGNYDLILNALVSALVPRDALEWLWTKDVADLILGGSKVAPR